MHRVSGARGYIGLLMLLVSAAILMMLYMYYSPLKPSAKSGQPTLSEGFQAIQDAKTIQELNDARNAQLQGQLR